MRKLSLLTFMLAVLVGSSMAQNKTATTRAHLDAPKKTLTKVDNEDNVDARAEKKNDSPKAVDLNKAPGNTSTSRSTEVDSKEVLKKANPTTSKEMTRKVEVRAKKVKRVDAVMTKTAVKAILVEKKASDPSTKGKKKQ